jgi:hypothetical protein
MSKEKVLKQFQVRKNKTKQNADEKLPYVNTATAFS